MQIDGFRFDLGTILGREPEGFDPRGGFFDAVTRGSGSVEAEAHR